MPAVDVCQPNIIHAIQKDGWRVRVQNVHFYDDGYSIYIDLGAERPQPTGENQRILIEIKCFAEKQSTSELYLALGQVHYYRVFLDELEDDTPIYLAVPFEAYISKLNHIFENALKQCRVGLIVIDIEDEEITEWREPSI